MKKQILFSLFLITAFMLAGCKSTARKAPVVPDGYQGIYVVKIWKGDNSVLPREITGLVLKRTGESYKIMLSNINQRNKSAEEIEELEYTYENGEFIIKFGSLMKVKPEKGGLRGTLDFDGKPAELFLKKIK